MFGVSIYGMDLNSTTRYFDIELSNFIAEDSLFAKQ